MFDVFTQTHDLCFNIQCSAVIDNILYVVITEGDANVAKLLKIDLIRMIMISSKTIDYRCHDNTVFKILKGKLYCYTTLIDVNDPEYAYINKEDVTFIDLNTLKYGVYVIDGLHDIIELNNKIYSVVSEEDGTTSIYELNEEQDTQENDYKYLTIKKIDGSMCIEDDTIYLNFDIDFSIEVLHFDNNLVFNVIDERQLICIDLDKKDINCNIILKDGKWYNHIGNNKLYNKNKKIYDYKNGKKTEFNLLIRNCFRYDDNDYYVYVDKFRKVFKIGIDISKHDVNTNFKYPESITLSSKDWALTYDDVGSELLCKSSLHIQDLLKFSKGKKCEFVNDNYSEVSVYFSYLLQSVIVPEKINELYKIASYMHYVDMEYLVYAIIQYVLRVESHIDFDWNILETFYNDNVCDKFLMLLYIIYRKHDREEFIKKVNGINPMNNTIVTELIRKNNI